MLNLNGAGVITASDAAEGVFELELLEVGIWADALANR